MPELSGEHEGVKFFLWKGIYLAGKSPRRDIRHRFARRDSKNGYFEGCHPAENPRLVVTLAEEEIRENIYAAYLALYGRREPSFDDARLWLGGLLAGSQTAGAGGEKVSKELEDLYCTLGEADRAHAFADAEKFRKILMA
jgi:hypothetical protein